MYITSINAYFAGGALLRPRAPPIAPYNKSKKSHSPSLSSVPSEI